MFSVIISLISFFVLLGVVYVFFSFFLNLRDTSNKLLIVASNEFFEMTGKLMKTPDELPESVLNSLETMTNSMNNGYGARTLLSALRQFNAEGRNVTSKSGMSPSLSDDVLGMRKELRDLFGHAVAAWLNYVVNRHVFYQLAIISELKKLAIRTSSVEVDQAKAGMSLLTRLPVAKC